MSRHLAPLFVTPALLLALAWPTGAAAATADMQDDGPTRILTSPPRVLASVAPGGTTKTTVLVANQSRSSASLVVRAADLAPDPEGATFGVLADVGDAPRGAGAWLTIDRPTIALGPGERTTINVTIRVPADASAGGHYGAVVVETAPAADGATDEPVRLRVRLATHVNVLVPGDVQYDGSINDIRVRRGDGGRIAFRATFENDGNIQTTPDDVRVRVIGPAGSRTVALDVPETMPGGRRDLRATVAIPAPAGTFDGRFSMRLEDGSRVRSRTASIVAWRPWVPWALGGILCVLLLVGLAVPVVRRHLELRRLIRQELEALELESSTDPEGSPTDRDG